MYTYIKKAVKMSSFKDGDNKFKIFYLKNE